MKSKILSPFNDDKAPDTFDVIYFLGAGIATGTILGMFVSSMYLFGLSAWPL